MCDLVAITLCKEEIGCFCDVYLFFAIGYAMPDLNFENIVSNISISYEEEEEIMFPAATLDTTVSFASE